MDAGFQSRFALIAILSRLRPGFFAALLFALAPGCFTSLLLAINRHVVHCRPSSVPVAGGTLDIVTSIHRGLVGLLRSTETASCRAMQDSGSPALYFAHFTSVALRFGGPA